NVPLERRRGGSCFNRATTARHSSANAGWSGARRGELTRDGVEQVGQVGADKPDRHDNGDGDQGDNQSVLNGGGPALLVLETVAQGGDEVGQSSHGLYSLGRAGAGEGASAELGAGSECRRPLGPGSPPEPERTLAEV